MASGCIMGDCPCPVCDELIWEDEWELVGDVFVHMKCKEKYIKRYRSVTSAIKFLESRGYEVKKKDGDT